MVLYSLILRDWEKGGEVGVDPTGCLRLLCPRPHQVRELMPLTKRPLALLRVTVSLAFGIGVSRCEGP